jgi:flagellin
MDRITEGLGRKIEAAFGDDYDVTYTAGSNKLDIAVAAGSTAAALTGSNTSRVDGGVKGLLAAMGGSDLKITTAQDAYLGLQAIDSALQVVNAERSNMGAIISRLQFASDNLSNVAAKAAESRSRIEDTDYSQATTELAKRNIIQQAAQAMLAQANQAPQLVLQLLK